MQSRAVEMVISFGSCSAGDELPYDTVKSPGITYSGNDKKRNPYHSLYDYKEQNKTWIDKILNGAAKSFFLNHSSFHTNHE